MGYLKKEKKWLFPLIMISAIFIIFLATSFNMGLMSSISTINSLFFFLPMGPSINQTAPVFAETKISSAPASAPSGPTIPRFAYFISGSKGDMEKLWRTLLALYHPLNHYLVHLDLESPVEERLALGSRIQEHRIFAEVGNVFMITKANLVTYRGPTMVANTLHACAILLKKSKDWDWFINLSASDYPLVTQDDLLYSFINIDRKLNFIEHTSQLGWKFEKRAKPLIIDPGLYMTTKSDVFWVNPKRTLPTAYKLFTEGYFQTLVCNVPELAKTAVNHDLHYISWDIPPRQHPHNLNINDTSKMITSNAAFARKFKQDEPAMDFIDKKLLRRRKGRFTPGGWCAGKAKCSKVGDIYNLKPGPGSQRLSTLLGGAIMKARHGQDQCI